MECKTSFSYEVKSLDSSAASMIAELAGIMYRNYDDATIFYSDIVTEQVELLDSRLNLYTIGYTQGLCEKTCFLRVRRCIYEQHQKPPLWAVEALARNTAHFPNLGNSSEELELLKKVAELYPEYEYLLAVK